MIRLPASGGSGADQGDLAESLASRVTRLVVLLRRELVPFGISLAQVSTLSTLRERGAQRLTALAEIERVAQPSMSVLVARMEGLGWVARKQEAGDRRTVIVEITEAGETLLRRIAEARTSALADHLAALEPGERAALVAALPALGRLVGNLEQREVPAHARK